MFFPRIRLKPLAALCHRLATATGAGLEDRRIWRDEAGRGNRQQQHMAGLVADQLEQGQPLATALRATDEYLPALFHKMVAVGEMSGGLDKTYKQLAEHYDHRVKVRRDFMGRMAWPMIQLGLAAAVIGALIWGMGMLPVNRGADGPQVDLLGFGLIGNRGLIVYANLVILFLLAVLLLVEASRRGMLWTRRLQRATLSVPVLGGALKTIALARFTWAAQMVFDTPMDLRRALPLALEASGNDYFAQHGPAVAASIEGGSDVYSALAQTNAFPEELLDVVAVGEQSGALAEAMRRVSSEYEQRAATASSILAQTFGYLIWLLVAVLIIMLIFRLANFYVTTIQSFT